MWSVLVEDKDPRGDRGATRSHTDLVQEEFVLEAAGARFLLHLGYND